MSTNLIALAESCGANVEFEPSIEFANVFQLQEFVNLLPEPPPENIEGNLAAARAEIEGKAVSTLIDEGWVWDGCQWQHPHVSAQAAKGEGTP